MAAHPVKDHAPTAKHMMGILGYFFLAPARDTGALAVYRPQIVITTPTIPQPVDASTRPWSTTTRFSSSLMSIPNCTKTSATSCATPPHIVFDCHGFFVSIGAPNCGIFWNA